MAINEDTTTKDQIQTATFAPYEMDEETYLLWIQSIGFVLERLNEDSGGSPDIEIRHIAQIQQYLTAQFASDRSKQAAPTDGEVTQKYAALRDELERLASGFAAIARTLESGDLDVAEDLVKVFEAYSCDVLEKHGNP